MCSVQIWPIQEGMDEQIPLAEEEEQRVPVARHGRRDGGPSWREDGVGGYR